MAAFFILSTSAVFLILTSYSYVIASCNPQYSNNNTIRGGYYPSWSKQLKPSAINTSFFTHIYYAFLVPNNVTFKFDIDNRTQAPLLRSFNSILHAKDPPVRTLFSIGGGAADPNIFARMASSKSSRSTFIKSSIDVARAYGFDGCDLDWEFAENDKEMKNLASLLEEWRTAVRKEAGSGTSRQPLLVTAAVYYSAIREQHAFPADSIKKNLDWVNVMNYDYHGAWDTSATGAQAALFDHPPSKLSTDYGIKTWIRAGVPSNKLIMGLPLYGKTWTLKDPAQHGVGAPAVGVGPGVDGVMTYAQVVESNKVNKVKGVFDKDTVSVYSVNKSSWIGYDDPTSVGSKLIFARTLELGGYFFWAIDQDYKWTISKAALDNW